MTDTQLYAVLPVPEHAPYPHPCQGCSGRGVTGARYEMPTDNGPTLLLEAICPQCGGCGNGDPEHADCPADAHADPDGYRGSDDDWDEDDSDDWDGDDGGPRCYSCGSGRGWNAVQGIGTSDDGDPDSLTLLRVPCGCSQDRLVIGADPAAL